MMPIETIDARAKLLHLFLTGMLLFFTKSLQSNMLYMLLLALIFCICGKPLFALKMVATYAFVFGIAQFLLMLPFRVAAAFGMKLFIISRFVPVSAFFSLLLKSTGIGQVIQALESWRVPRALTIPLSVMFRLTSTIRQEMGHIADAMRMRGIHPTPWGFIKGPATMLEHLFIPILMRAVKISEELAASAVVRGLENPVPRTVRIPLCWQAKDSIYVVLVLLMHGAVIALDRGVLSV